MSSVLGPDEVEALLADIDDAPFQEFRFGSKLLARAGRLSEDDLTDEKDRVTRALVMRHHFLQNKEAESCVALRHAIKEIQGIYFNTLWDMLLSDTEIEAEAASFVIGEVGGVGAFQKILNTLRLKKVEWYPRLLPCLAHVIQRYYEVLSEAEPTATIMDTATGETKTVVLRDFDSGLYRRKMMARSSMNEFFRFTSDGRVNEMVALLREIPPRYFGPIPPDQLAGAIENLKSARSD